MSNPNYARLRAIKAHRQRKRERNQLARFDALNATFQTITDKMNRQTTVATSERLLQRGTVILEKMAAIRDTAPPEVRAELRKRAWS
jgi:hypothetical protein